VVQQVYVERPHTKEEFLGLDFVATLKKHGVAPGIRSLTYYINQVRSYSPHNSDSDDRVAYKSLKREMIQEKEQLTSRQLKLERDQLDLKRLLMAKPLEAEQHKKRLTKHHQLK
jgi:hypothetical protein